MGKKNETNAVKPDRRRVSITPGEYVTHENEIYKIIQEIDFTSITATNTQTGQNKVLLIEDISVVDSDIFDNGYVFNDFAELADNDWKEIERRFKIIKPLLNGASRKEIENHSKSVGIHFTTLYKWLRSYTKAGTMAALLSKKPGSEPGKGRIPEASERIITGVIEEHYLTEQRFKPQEIIRLVNIECKKQKVYTPSKNTVRARIALVSERERLRRQGNTSKARTLFGAVPGSFPNADFPLAVVQIDHTPLDIILVDDEHRRPIGRPFITVAIDVYSRMITGYYLSLDPPSSLSVSMCIAHSILPKEDWMILQGVDAEWPVWGFMHTIHTDNGADFRAKTLTDSCLIHRINIEFRPVCKTNYGGHVERVIGTLNTRIHSLPGTTFSNIKEKDTYDSDKHAGMTFSDFEKWLVTFITKEYHKKEHLGIGVSPEAKWNEGIFGSDGIGYPPRPTDSETLLIDFLPLFERTVQKNGVNIDGLNYYDHTLHFWINAIDPKTEKKQKFIFRRDSRDISYIWFFEPKLKTYYKIPLANQALPSVSIWEHRENKERIKAKGITSISDNDLIDVHEELNKQITDSVKKSKKVRRKVQNKKVHINSKNITKTNAAPAKTPVNNDVEDDLWDDDEIVPFD